MSTILITGSSRGIGAAVAEKFAREGWNVVINYNRHEAEAKALAKVNILPQLINKLLFRIVGKKSTAHILATCRGLYHSA